MSNTEDRKSVEEALLRITAALYRVTDLFEDEEPLKWGLRRDAMEIVGMFLRGTKSSDHIGERVGILTKKLYLAQVGGFISRINFEVLEREYRRSALALQNIKDRTIMDGGENFLGNIYEEDKRTKEVAIKDTIGHNRQKINVQYVHNDHSAIESERFGHIEAFLAGKGLVSVGEIQGAYGGHASKKTIQRDLHKLAQAGRIRAEGDKRWRRYAKVDGL